MALSDKIEAFISELLKNEENEWLELKRNELASVFNCVPSQINYVISTRFNSTNGYMVESRRGGGGYLRIKRIPINENLIYIKAVQSIGESSDFPNAVSVLGYLKSNNAITQSDMNLMLSAVSDRALCISQPAKNIVRANILKNMIVTKSQEV